MTDQQQAAMRQALDALESVLCDPDGNVCWHGSYADRDIIGDALHALRHALEQQSVDEPVATDWEQIARVQDAKLRAMCGEAGGFEKLCEVMDRYEARPQPAAPKLPIELRCVQKTVKEGGGFWRSCTGCHELNEGHDTGPFSKVFGCALGNGCRECGGIGAIWDDTDYEDMGRAMIAAAPEQKGNV